MKAAGPFSDSLPVDIGERQLPLLGSADGFEEG